MKVIALTTLAVVISLVGLSSSAPATDVVKASVIAKEEPTPAPTVAPTIKTTTRAPAPTPDHTHKPDHTHPPHTHTHTEDCKKQDSGTPAGEYYDQRQNGTHNIRVEIDNIVILHAPLDMGSASTEGDEEIAEFLTQLSQLAESEAANKDKPSTAASITDGNEEKPDKDKLTAVKNQKKTRTKVRLATLLGPLLRQHV